MTRRMLWPLLFGLFGCAILVSLGVWQVQRLAWKQEILAAMDARITDAPVALPERVDPQAHRYLHVAVSGTILNDEIRIMASQRGAGPGFRLIAPFETDGGRRLLLDRGFVPEAARDRPRPAVAAEITGNLHWPDEVDAFTPDPDRAARLWFARDVASMAAELETEPLLIVLRTTSEADPPAEPMPLDTSAIPDNHRNYAITWFLLAFAWAGMTGFLLWRIRQQNPRGA